jgi:arylamine N-acetyltransferase
MFLCPSPHRLSGGLCNFELNGTLGFLLHDYGARHNVVPVRDITDLQLNEIAAAKLAVNREIE